MAFGFCQTQDSLNVRPHLSDSLLPYLRRLNPFAAGPIAQCPIKTPVRKSLAGQLRTCQSDKWAGWPRPYFWALPWMHAAVWRGGRSLKIETIDKRGKGKTHFGSSGWGIFNCASFLPFLVLFPVLFFPAVFLLFPFTPPLPLPASPVLPAGPLDTEREIHAAPHVSEKLIQLFRNKSEFTFLATVQQKPSTSGVILSIRELEHR